MIKVSDYMARFMAERGARHLFAISGAGNLHFLDSIGARADLSLVCPHHEQAGVMAAMAYHRVSGRPGVMITTAGGGASNAITGVLDAWADSIPVLVISGQEKSASVKAHGALRMYGVQGFDIVSAVKGITTYAAQVLDPKQIRFQLEKAFHFMTHGRPGPVWLDIPIDVQGAQVDETTLEGFTPPPPAAPSWQGALEELLADLAKAERPVVLLGHGLRLAGAASVVPRLLDVWPAAAVTSWNGADLVPSSHPRFFGRPGNYGQRCANFVVQNADLLVTLGSRLAIPQVGYDYAEYARGAKKYVVDIDPTELAKFAPGTNTRTVQADAGAFARALLERLQGRRPAEPRAWLSRCEAWRAKYPLYDPALHADAPGMVNSYRFVEALARTLADDEVIVTDMGTALTCTHQTIALKSGQRLVTSTGLGEMGYGLPASVGASLALDKRRVVLIDGDGSMMMNLQELQTIAHHRLPVKMFIYVNDGYLSIKHTQLNMFGPRFTGSGEKSGVTCPDFRKLATAFGFTSFRIEGPEGLDQAIARALEAEGPVVCEVVTHPVQPLVPKLSFKLKSDGSMVSPPIEDLYPFLPRGELKEQMIVPLHPKSVQLGDPEDK